MTVTITPDRLGSLFRPRSVALVGASDRSAFSSLEFRNLVEFGFGDRTYLVNRRRAETHGRATVTSCTQIGEPVDVASPDRGRRGPAVRPRQPRGRGRVRAAGGSGPGRRDPRGVPDVGAGVAADHGIADTVDAVRFRSPAHDEVTTSEDAIEGARAFAEKRRPRWRNR